MKTQQRPSLLALSALLLCTLQQTAGSHRRSSASSSSASSSSASASSASPSEGRGRNAVGTARSWLTQTNISYGNHSHGSRPPPPPELKEAPGHGNTSRGTLPAVISERSGRTPSWSPEEEVSPVCAYRVIEGGIGGQLCFRHTLFGYKCPKEGCRTVVSLGNLVANILTNGSVLLQWTYEGDSTNATEPAAGRAGSGHPGPDLTSRDTPRSNTVLGGRRHRRGGYELSCWWNGSYTQFECAGAHLGSGCRDFLLAELHENIPYRLCVRALGAKRAEQRDCVEFTLPPSGMQDIVIAMTTVGGAICVMLVIICLLVAYITENIMSPTTQHTYSYRTHSRH